MDPEKITITFVGDHCCGKTSLIISHLDNYFPLKVSKCAEQRPYAYNLDGNLRTIQIFDTNTSSEYSRLRALSYPISNIIFLCFSCVDANSYESVFSRWCYEVTHHCPHTPVFVVATKIDLLRETKENGPFVDMMVAKKRAEEIGGQYFMCSAMTGEGVRTLFESAFRKVDSREKRPLVSTSKKDCEIL